MHEAVKLILKRMDSNPDEFVKGQIKARRWDRLLMEYEPYMTEKEKEGIKQRYSEIQMEQLHKEVMAELLRGDEIDAPFTGIDISLPYTSPFSSSEQQGVELDDDFYREAMK